MSGNKDDAKVHVAYQVKMCCTDGTCDGQLCVHLHVVKSAFGKHEFVCCTVHT